MNAPQKTQKTQKTLTELEERLASAEGAKLKQTLAASLRETEARLSARVSGPVPKSEFASLNASLEAVRVAQVVLFEWVPGTAAG
jgi:hypothetical protein